MAYSLPPPPRLPSSPPGWHYIFSRFSRESQLIHSLATVPGVCGVRTSSPTHVIACVGHLFEIFSRSRCSTRGLRQRGVRQPDESPGRAHLHIHLRSGPRCQRTCQRTRRSNWSHEHWRTYKYSQTGIDTSWTLFALAPCLETKQFPRLPKVLSRQSLGLDVVEYPCCHAGVQIPYVA